MPKVKLFNEEEVLEKAMLLFWKKGYHNTSIQDLVDDLGISRSSLYDSFGGKKKLYERVLNLYRSSQNYGLSNFLATQNKVKEGFRLVFQKVIEDDFVDADCKGCFIVNTTTELIPADLNMQELVTRHKEYMEDLFLGFLKKGVQSGEISKSKDIKTIARLFYTFLTGLRVLGKTSPSREESLEKADMILSVLN